MNSEVNENLITMPALALRGIVIYPGMLLQFDVGRERSINAIKVALETNRKIFLVTQRDIKIANPEMKDLYKVGVVAEVKQMLKTGGDTDRVLVKGLCKAKACELIQIDPYYTMTVEYIKPRHTASEKSATTQALIRSVKDTFDSFAELTPKMPSELYASIIGEDEPQKLFENIVFNLPLPISDKQKLLETSGIKRRLEILNGVLKEELQIMKIEKQIQDDVKYQIDNNQREYYLREQLKAISNELGDGEDLQDEVYEFYSKLEKLNLSEDTNNKLHKEIDKLVKMPQGSHEGSVIYNYLDTVLSLPWNVETKDKLNIKDVEKQLDKDHYGLKKVKERITEILAVRQLSSEAKGQIICLVGPPGVGKTSIGRSIAKALGKKYSRVSLGGIKDESDIRGHRKTYIGAMPGRIMNAIIQAKSNNPLILLDEIDKMGSDFKGDPSSAMLEVLDSEQNINFVDHYIEVGFDLSNVLFVTTANTTDTIPAPLLDRMDVIELGSYTRQEKFQIAKNHLIKKQYKKNGLTAAKVKISDDAVFTLIDGYTREAGVRNLEREIASLCRKAAKQLVSGELKKVNFTSNNIEKYLGPVKFRDDDISKKDEAGIVNGLAWTSVGGVMMSLEAVVLKGTGKIEITGNLGDVMTESAKIAVSYVRTVADKYGINPDFYKENDIHINAIEGAVPKDGPSAGVTMVTAMVSALSGIPVKHDVAMTGEITLHGKVLPIGGLREKTMAAYKAGMKTVIVPKLNEPDMYEVEETVKQNLNFVFASTLQEVLDTALTEKSKASENMPLISGVINPIKEKTNTAVES